MKNKSHWALYVRSYRLSQKLTQAEVAQQFGVAPPTISRWESGRQDPSLEAQKRLQANIDFRQNMTEAAWCERVKSSHFYELLFAPNRGIIAASIAARGARDLDSDAIMGKLPRDFLPGGAAALERELKRFKYADLSDIGIFSGLIRQIYFVLDYRIGERVYTRAFDIWPILSSDRQPLAHAIGADQASPDDAASVRDLRIRACDVTRTLPKPGRWPTSP